MNLRSQAIAIFKAAVTAADPEQAVVAQALGLPIARFRKVSVVGAGKAGASMAKAIERTLGSRITSGWINVKYGHTTKLRRIHLHECGHPVPDENGVRGALEISRIASEAGEDDLLLCLISGGASALLPLPASPVTLRQKRQVTKLLLARGADIHEMNTVRKHLSAIKGGQLAKMAYPATVVCLILSDVIGDDLDVIGSGPTVPDSSTIADAEATLRKYSLAGKVKVVRETPKADDPTFRRTTNVVIGSNRLAVDAAAARAKELGFRTLVLSTRIEGETRDVARVHAAIAKEIALDGRPVKPPACVLSGGETTVTLRGKGLGGRNQEFVLAAAIDIAGLKDVVMLSGGTDGTDGPTDAAGAVADGGTLERALAAGLDARKFLAENDSYSFFRELGDLLMTGPTNTNVMDVHVILVT